MKRLGNSYSRLKILNPFIKHYIWLKNIYKGGEVIDNWSVDIRFNTLRNIP